jgi:hypothetical protein
MEYAAEKAIEAVGGFIKDKIPETSNPNLLINPDFKINQRNISGAFSDTGKYFADRWRLESGTVTVNSDNTITLNGTICQPLENAVGSSITASVSAGTAVYDDSAKTFTITGNGVNISWAKLEIGNTATAFSPPDYVSELLKCQRYYQALNRFRISYGYVPSNLVVSWFVPYPIAMRTNPSASFFADGVYIDTPPMPSSTTVSYQIAWAVNGTIGGVVRINGTFSASIANCPDTNHFVLTANSQSQGIILDAEIY